MKAVAMITPEPKYLANLPRQRRPSVHAQTHGRVISCYSTDSNAGRGTKALRLNTIGANVPTRLVTWRISPSEDPLHAAAHAPG